MDTNQKLQFAPFAAINQFMLPEFRQEVIGSVLKQITELSAHRRKAINDMTRRYVKISGFRNSEIAPLPFRIRQSGSAFENHSDFTAQVISGWSELKPVLGKQVFDLLSKRGWNLIPLEADRTKVPGFLIIWPKEETYDVLDAAFHKAYPTETDPDNDIRLMIVWISGRLPYDVTEPATD